MADDVTDPLEIRPGYQLKRAAAAAMSDLNDRLSVLDLRQVDASVMLMIQAEPNVIASHIGRVLDIKSANMVPLLRRLEERGLIEKVPLDGKSHGLHLTAAGETIMIEANAILDRFETDLMERIPAEHREHLAPALRAIWHSDT
ncbi:MULTISPECIES: MarR family winged helix-turn-helix transcriptional regulator [Novosphingobium]|uniref:DNA-binding transcriptional regulator, MarR family n=1 Tax=Novosphingobium mathurense TaxID=428990 RepID=A0A1U6ISH1_9SPHN|nr:MULTISPECIES: winged helix DNA-binding protein [Novosphingobium]CDO34076.1 Transcriptional regulator, MarR family [Novosphingobium sp. KN65.2]SLK10892.1 DNA-binding transcriptional regulator, MarR family [Novosphingobium mathurense]